MIQLPDDVVENGYKQTSSYNWEQVFFSPSKNFEGTEKDFVTNRLGYEYVDISPYKRLSIK